MTTNLVDAHGQPTTPARNACVAICVPCGDQVAAGFAFDMARMLAYTAAARPDIGQRLLQMKGTLIADQRHNLVLEAKKHADVTHLLWLDSDMRFPKDALIRLLAHEVPIVAAAYVTRRTPCVSTGEILGKGTLVLAPDAEGVIEVDRVGMGLMLTRVDLFDDALKPWFAIGYSPKFDGYYVSEDVYFCRKMKTAGTVTLVDLGLSRETGHLGEFEFRNEHARAYAAAMQETEAPAETSDGLSESR